MFNKWVCAKCGAVCDSRDFSTHVKDRHRCTQCGHGRHDCLECGKDCADYYMVADAAWASAVPNRSDGKPGPGLLHIACLEKRLGRVLDLLDFSPSIVNDTIRWAWRRGTEEHR